MRESYALLLRNCRIRERVLIVEDAELSIEREHMLSDPKGRKTRTADMTDRIAEALERHMARTGGGKLARAAGDRMRHLETRPPSWH